MHFCPDFRLEHSAFCSSVILCRSALTMTAEHAAFAGLSQEQVYNCMSQRNTALSWCLSARPWSQASCNLRTCICNSTCSMIVQLACSWHCQLHTSYLAIMQMGLLMTCCCCLHAVGLLLRVIYADTVAPVEQHLHVLFCLVPHWLCAVSAARPILCVEGTQGQSKSKKQSAGVSYSSMWCCGSCPTVSAVQLQMLRALSHFCK